LLDILQSVFYLVRTGGTVLGSATYRVIHSRWNEGELAQERKILLYVIIKMAIHFILRFPL